MIGPLKVIGLAFGAFDELDDGVVFRARVSFHPEGDGGAQGGIIHGAGRDKGQRSPWSIFSVAVDPGSDIFLQSPNFPKPYPKSVEVGAVVYYDPDHDQPNTRVPFLPPLAPISLPGSSTPPRDLCSASRS